MQLMGQTVMIQHTQAEKNRLAAAQEASKASGPTRLYVGSLHYNITEDDIRNIFDPFGDIEVVQLQTDTETGRSKGYGFVQYKNPDDAKKAMQQINGLELVGRQLKVTLVNDPNHNPGLLGELDDDEGGGLSMNAERRAALMQKLQRTDGEDGSSPCLVLTGMFEPQEISTPALLAELKEDITEEASKFGKVVHIFVDMNSQGYVYLKYSTVQAAENAVSSLNGRWFASKQVGAEIVPESEYYMRFPEALAS